MKSDANKNSFVWKMMWALAWRYVLWLPLLVPIGTIAFFLVIAFPIVPPAYAIALIFGGQWPLALGILVAWGIGMYFYKRAMSKMFEGFSGL